MDDPETSILSGEDSARARSSRATRAGSVVDIAGLPLRLRGTDNDRAAMFDVLFGALPRLDGPPVGEVVYRRRGVTVPSRPPDEVYTDLDVWHEGDDLFLASAYHGLQAVATPDRAVIGGPGQAHHFGLRRLLHPIFTHLLAWHGLYVVHGAALRRGDNGIMVLGQTGQGKSTLALAALEHGWGVLADDLVAVRSDPDGIVLRGVPKPLALPGELAAEALDGSEPLEWDKRGRRHLPSDRLDLRPVRLRAILVVAHGDQTQATLAPARPRELTTLLFSSFMSTPDAPMLRRFFPVGAALARTPTWTFHHSVVPAVRLAEAAAALDRLTAAW